MSRTAEKLSIELNGVRQGYFLMTSTPVEPVLLVLHGGPGMPEYWLTRRYPTGLEQLFRVAWWEQRGAALSSGRDVRDETITIEQLVADTVAAADHLRASLGVEKVYLMGHSWGTFLGLLAAQAAPDRFFAYVGVAQVTCQLRSEARSQEYLAAGYRGLGRARLARRISRLPVLPDRPVPAPYLRLRDRAMHELGVGTTRDMRSVVTGLFLPSLLAPEYTPAERLALWRGKLRSRWLLWDEFVGTDLTRTVRTLQVPAYFLHGRHDQTVNRALARDFATTLDAPVVGFYTFEHSAHSPHLEEPELTRRILATDVLRGTSTLADHLQPH